ncbi:MAG: TlpA family protein disulfide reductase [Chloroflexota bacterium]
MLAVVPLGPPAPATNPGASPVVVGGSPLLDRPAPPIELADLDGRTVRLADYAGRPVIVNFWASWCVPCRDEFPAFVAARAAHADAGLEVLGIIHKDLPDPARAFAAAQGAAWPLLPDPGEVVYDAYRGVGGIPISVFIDGGGIVRAVSFGPLSETALALQLARILPAS